MVFELSLTKEGERIRKKKTSFSLWRHLTLLWCHHFN